MGKTAEDQLTLGQTDRHGRRRRGTMTDTLSGGDGCGPGQQCTSPPPPSVSRAHPQPPGATALLGARPGSARTTALKAAVPGRQTGERGEDGAAKGKLPLALRLSRGGRGCGGGPGVLFLPLPARACRGCGPWGAASHDGAAVAAQRALEAQGGVHVLAACAADALEQLAEEQQDVPVVLGRALHVAALPGLAHQV